MKNFSAALALLFLSLGLIVYMLYPLDEHEIRPMTFSKSWNMVEILRLEDGYIHIKYGVASNLGDAEMSLYVNNDKVERCSRTYGEGWNVGIDCLIESDFVEGDSIFFVINSSGWR